MHILGKFALPRRHMLRGLLGGATVAIGLPPLEAMMSGGRHARAGLPPPPLRFVSFFFGNGVQLRRWEPTEVGAAWTLSEQLAPFEPVKDYVTICSGMANRTSSAPITHHEGITVMSGYDYIPSDAGGIASEWGGPTIDQVIADIIAEDNALPIHSMQVGVSKFDSPVDNGTAAKAVSAQGVEGAITAKFPTWSPRQVWDNLFLEFEAPKADAELRLSVLDAVREDIVALRQRLGTQDKQRLEQHISNIGELENKINALPPACDVPDPYTYENDEANGSEDTVLTNQLMSELIAYAFVCDVTRVASNLFCSVASEAIFNGYGTLTHHTHSHNDDEGYHQNIVMIMGCISSLLQTLQATPDIEGESLLESTLVFASSELSQGWSHSWNRQPIIIGGHGRGHLKHPGIHFQAVAQNEPADDTTSAGNTTDVLLALARAFDPELPSIGGGTMMSTEPLSDILA